MKNRITILTVASCIWATTTSAVTVVHWGGSNLAANYSQNLTTGKNVDTLDLGTPSNPTVGSSYYSDSTDANPVFYAASLWTYDGTPAAGNFVWRVDPTATGQITTSINTGVASDPLTSSIQSIYIWQKENFLNGGDANPVALNDITLNTGVNGGAGSLRFVVQNGSNWYVSDSTTTQDLSLSSFTTSWYDYDPVEDFTDFTGAIAGVTTNDFTDVTAVGLWMDKTATGQYIVRTFQSIDVDATVVPEPSTYAMLVGFAALTLVYTRRRR